MISFLHRYLYFRESFLPKLTLVKKKYKKYVSSQVYVGELYNFILLQCVVGDVEIDPVRVLIMYVSVTTEGREDKPN